MGKKRTNTASKKKQAAKKKKLSSVYGVSVLKGGTIARNNGLLNAKQNSGIQPKKRNKKVAISGDSIGGSPQVRSVSNENVGESSKSSSRTVSPKRPRGSNNEHVEFNRLHASLEERSLLTQARKENQQRSKKERQKTNKRGWGDFAGPSSTKFAPAILTLAPKSTQELVEEATNQVAEGMNTIGQRAIHPTYSLSAVEPGKSSLAAAVKSNWKLKVANYSPTPQQSLTENNPYAALGESDDSDMEASDRKPSMSTPQFQFRPATFSFQSNFTLQSASLPGPHEIDPDL